MRLERQPVDGWRARLENSVDGALAEWMGEGKMRVGEGG